MPFFNILLVGSPNNNSPQLCGIRLGEIHMLTPLLTTSPSIMRWIPVLDNEVAIREEDWEHETFSYESQNLTIHSNYLYHYQHNGNNNPPTSHIEGAQDILLLYSCLNARPRTPSVPCINHNHYTTNTQTADQVSHFSRTLSSSNLRLKWVSRLTSLSIIPPKIVVPVPNPVTSATNIHIQHDPL